MVSSEYAKLATRYSQNYVTIPVMSLDLMPSPTIPRDKLADVVELLSMYTAEPVYPESDGEPMAETDIHRDQMTDALLHPLKIHLQGKAYVTGNILLYYEEGNTRASVAPDVFVVFDSSDQPRRTYKVWEEGKSPNVVFELTSKSTRNKDLNDKRWLYESLGVQEYFLFDPLNEYLTPPLQGFRLQSGYYMHLSPQILDDGRYTLYSETLNLRLETSPNGLRLWNPVTETYLRTPAETESEVIRLQALLAQYEQN